MDSGAEMKKIISLIAILVFVLSQTVFACQTNGIYPDKECTPGSVYEEATVEIICVPGYSATVRATKQSQKRKVYEMYNIPVEERKQYVLDHLISLQLGGRDDVDNLFPQRREKKPNSRDKDRIENFLKRSVCKGEMTLKEAQETIREDWVEVFDDMVENEGGR